MLGHEFRAVIFWIILLLFHVGRLPFIVGRRSLVGKLGRKPVLDEGKRREIVAILSVGGSQTTAARYVGCAVSTIQNTAARDPEFAQQFRQAACNNEIGLLRYIRNAAKKEQYWRAAAWALERGFPEKYARRGPDVITVEQIAILLAQVSDIVQQIPELYRKDIVKRMDALARSVGCKLKRNASDDPQ
jgi:hypothetical protein